MGKNRVLFHNISYANGIGLFRRAYPERSYAHKKYRPAAAWSFALKLLFRPGLPAGHSSRLAICSQHSNLAQLCSNLLGIWSFPCHLVSHSQFNILDLRTKKVRQCVVIHWQCLLDLVGLAYLYSREKQDFHEARSRLISGLTVKFWLARNLARNSLGVWPN
jgi:hypothetical protein